MTLMKSRAQKYRSILKYQSYNYLAIGAKAVTAEIASECYDYNNRHFSGLIIYNENK
jgi:hypothetical protein